MTAYEELLSEYPELDVSEHGMIREGYYCDGCVWINKDLTEEQKVCVLAEEIGHDLTSYGDILDQKDIKSKQQEHRARVWAYNKILSMDKIEDAREHGYTEIYEIAEYLGVCEKFLGAYLKYQNIFDVSSE